MLRRWILRGVVLLVGLFLVIQLVPYGRDHSNPSGRSEPPWADAETRRLTQQACFDCHSNETRWPWYSFVAPVSWLVQRDVDVGRAKVNFSEWGRSSEDETDELAEVVLEGEMPPWFYPVMHPEASLSQQEKQALADGLQRTVGAQAADSGGDD